MSSMGGILQYVGASVTAGGGALGGEVTNDAAQYNATVDRNNAKLVEGQAKVEEARNRQDSYRALSAMRAGFGASGVTAEGSPMDVLEASARDAELDAQLIRFGGKVKSKVYTAAAALEQFEGKSARVGAYIKSIGGLVSAIGGGSSGNSGFSMGGGDSSGGYSGGGVASSGSGIS